MYGVHDVFHEDVLAVLIEHRNNGLSVHLVVGSIGGHSYDEEVPIVRVDLHAIVVNVISWSNNREVVTRALCI